MTWNPKQRILAAMSLALIAAAVVAGNANADRPDDRAGMIGVGAASASASTNPYGTLGPSPARVERVDQTRAPNPYGTPGPSPQRVQQITPGAAAFERAVARSTSTATRPDDRGEARGPGVYFSVPPIPTTSVSVEDFQWGDASAGAGAMLAAILLAAGLAVSIRHRGRTIQP